MDERVLSRIPWAYASLNEYDAELFQAAAAAAAAHIDANKMSPQVPILGEYSGLEMLCIHRLYSSSRQRVY